MKVTVSQAKAEEEGERDLSITDLHRWQQALNIPLEELLVPPTTSLSEPIRQRACMIRAGKTAKTLLKTCQGVRNQRLARRLMDQLVELMPELAEVGAWPEGTLRSRDELGRGAYPVITGDWTNPLTTY
jgi:transcriptional regulator with XRE-family HTH domain